MKYTEEHRACPICNHNMIERFKVKPKWTPCHTIKDETGKYFHMQDVMCMYCGLIFKNPMMSTQSQLEFYNGHYARLFKGKLMEGISKTAINESILTTIYTLDWLNDIGFSLKGKEVFEIGTGMGLLMKGMEGEGAIVSGLDSDERSIEIANKLFGFNFEYKSFQNYQEKKLYDLVVCNNTLEHFYNPQWLLSRLTSMLKPNGYVLIEVPDARLPYPGTLSDAFLSPAHNFTFVRETVEGLASTSGYSIEKIDNAGHKKCFLILLKPDSKALNKPIPVVKTEELKEELLSLYRENDTNNANNQAWIKELSSGIYVNSIIYRIKEESPNTYNFRNIVLANSLLEAGRPLDGLKILTEYGPDQPEDPNCNYGTFLYIKAMCYRQLGDFILSKKLLEECANYYPNIRKYNFVKDLEIDGLVSNSVFSSYMFWNAEKILQSYG